MAFKKVLFPAAAAIGGSLAYLSIYNVPSGHRGVIFDRFEGVQKETKAEGLHVLIPVRQKSILFDIRPKTFEAAQKVTLQNGQEALAFNLLLTYSPNESDVVQIFQDFGMNFAQTIIPSVTAQVSEKVLRAHGFKDETVLTEQLTEALEEGLDEYGIQLLRLEMGAITKESF